MVDILPEIDGVDFDRARRRRVMETIDFEAGLKAASISTDDLLAAKPAAGRAQDFADAETLRKAPDRAVRGTIPKLHRVAKRNAPPRPSQ